MNDTTLVTRVCNDAHVPRRQGISFGEEIEQITDLLFLERDEEREVPLGEGSATTHDQECSAGLAPLGLGRPGAAGRARGGADDDEIAGSPASCGPTGR